MRIKKCKILIVYNHYFKKGNNPQTKIDHQSRIELEITLMMKITTKVLMSIVRIQQKSYETQKQYLIRVKI